MGQVYSILSHTYTYYTGLFHYLWGDGRCKPYYASKALLGNTAGTGEGVEKRDGVASPPPSGLQPLLTDPPDKSLFKRYANIHLYTLASNFYLYNKPHYRKGCVFSSSFVCRACLRELSRLSLADGPCCRAASSKANVSRQPSSLSSSLAKQNVSRRLG